MYDVGFSLVECVSFKVQHISYIASRYHGFSYFVRDPLRSFTCIAVKHFAGSPVAEAERAQME